MSASLPMITLHEKFTKQALDLRMALGEAASCVVSQQIFYQMPDSPSILQEYVFQQDDVFEPGIELMMTLNKFEARIHAAQKVTELVDIYEAWGEFAHKAQAKIHEESWQYLRPVLIRIASNDRTLIANNLQRIPFPKTRKTLVAWAKNIDGLPREVHLDARPTTVSGVGRESTKLMHATTYSIN